MRRRKGRKIPLFRGGISDSSLVLFYARLPGCLLSPLLGFGQLPVTAGAVLLQLLCVSQQLSAVRVDHAPGCQHEVPVFFEMLVQLSVEHRIHLLSNGLILPKEKGQT